jgi:hypothetical protein
MDKARSSAKEESTLEDHRVLMSLMVNMFMPNYSWLKKTLFLKLCHFWVMGGVLINDMWWARLPVDNPPGGESDPRFKPSTAEKEFYDRLWLLCKTFIGLGGQEWNEMIKEIQTEMGAGSYELVMAKMEETLGNEEDIKSLKSVLGEAFVKELLNLVSSEIGEIGEVGDLFSDINEGITEIKSTLPSVADINLTEKVEDAKEFYDSVIAKTHCSEDDSQCLPGTKVKTKRNISGTVVNFDDLSEKVKSKLNSIDPDISDPIYVSFKELDIPGFTNEEHKNDNGEFVYKYKKEKLQKDDDTNTKEKLQEYIKSKIEENVAGDSSD